MERTGSEGPEEWEQAGLQMALDLNTCLLGLTSSPGCPLACSAHRL
jgi:hypothetical protein